MLCIIVGIGLGQAVPGVFHALGAATVAQVNLPVAVLVWLMIVPMLLKIVLAALGWVLSRGRGRRPSEVDPKLSGPIVRNHLGFRQQRPRRDQ
jgi:hypothetical protein